jgi:hypothetical protein
MFDALLWIALGVVVGAFAGDAFGARVRAFVMSLVDRVRGNG